MSSPYRQSGPQLVPGSRSTCLGVFSLNARNQFCEKAQEIKSICLQLNNFPAKSIKWNCGFRFFHSSQVSDEVWKNPKLQFDWIYLAGKLFKCSFFKGILSSFVHKGFISKVFKTLCILINWYFCIHWYFMLIILWQNTTTGTFITNMCSWNFGLRMYPWSVSLTKASQPFTQCQILTRWIAALEMLYH